MRKNEPVSGAKDQIPSSEPSQPEVLVVKPKKANVLADSLPVLESEEDSSSGGHENINQGKRTSKAHNPFLLVHTARRDVKPEAKSAKNETQDQKGSLELTERKKDPVSTTKEDGPDSVKKKLLGLLPFKKDIKDDGKLKPEQKDKNDDVKIIKQDQPENVKDQQHVENKDLNDDANLENDKVELKEKQKDDVKLKEDQKCDAKLNQDKNDDVKLKEDQKCDAKLSQDKNDDVKLKEDQKCDVKLNQDKNDDVKLTHDTKSEAKL